MSEYSLAEDANDVVVTAPGTPIAGVLLDAYNYFKNTVFQELDDPSINCRNHIIVYLTDGLDECNSNACAGRPHGQRPLGRPRGQIPLPENPAGAAGSAHALDSTVRIRAFRSTSWPWASTRTTRPSSASRPTRAARLRRQRPGARSRRRWRTSSTSGPTRNFFSSPAVPAFAAGFSDTAQIGAVVPSHINEDTSLSLWSDLERVLKRFKLDSERQHPGVTAVPSPTDDADAGRRPRRRRPRRSVPPTHAASGPVAYPDETTSERRLGRSSPAGLERGTRARLHGSRGEPRGGPGAGRRRTRRRRLPRSTSGRAASCSGPPASGGARLRSRAASSCPTRAPARVRCFHDLVTSMGLAVAGGRHDGNQRRELPARRRERSFGSRDEVLNRYDVLTPARRPCRSAPAPASSSATRTSTRTTRRCRAIRRSSAPTARSPPKGYSHKLGDIFHSEPVVVEPPRYFQYLSANLAPERQAVHRLRRAPPAPAQGRLGRRQRRVPARLRRRRLGPRHDELPDDTSTSARGARSSATRSGDCCRPRFPGLLEFPPPPQYFVDGSFGTADVFIDTNFAAAPVHREPRLEDGRRRRAAPGRPVRLRARRDVSRTPSTRTPVSPTFGEITAAKDNSPACLDGGGAGCPQRRTRRSCGS